MFTVKNIAIALVVVIAACQFSAGASAKAEVNELGSNITDRYEMINNL